MKFYAGDIFRGASIPLREAIRGDDALENFKTASKQGISNFFSGKKWGAQTFFSGPKSPKPGLGTP